MTREEAIEVLSDIRLLSALPTRIGALDMAIAALREQDATDINVGNKTNADHIRSMTDEELLGCLLELQDTAIKRFANFELPNYQWMADWLKQPYKEDT